MISVDQVLAFVALADQGNIRAAAKALFLSEQGARNRLVTLEQTLGANLYQKGGGRRIRTRLTEEGRRFLPRAREFLARAEALGRTFADLPETQAVHVAASAYLITYVLIEAVRRFHRRHPEIRIHLASRPEREIQAALLENSLFSMGVAAPYEPATGLSYIHQFSMNWSLIAPRGHPLLSRRRVTLRDVGDYPFILFEHGSTGRQHVLEAFGRLSLEPRIEMEATTTQIVVQMVEAGLGISIVPLLPGGVVTRGVRVGVRPLGKQIRAIESGILVRSGEALSSAATRFLEFLKSTSGYRGTAIRSGR